MKIQVEEVAPGVKSLTVEIPQEVCVGEFARAFSDLQKTASVSGFRPGKVPRSLIEKRYGDALHDDVSRRLVSDYYQKALEETALWPVGHPSFDQIRIAKNAPISFTVKVEVAPRIEPLNYVGIGLTRHAVAINEAEVDATLLRIQKDHGVLDVCPDDDLIVEGDHVSIDLSGSADGTPLAQGTTSYTLQVGKHQLPPALEAPIIGKKKGDAYEADVAFPPEEKNQEIAGKTVRFQVSITGVKKEILPLIDDDLAKDAGFDSLDELRNEVRAACVARAEGVEKSKQKAALLDQIVADHSFDLPPSMLHDELHRLIEREEDPDPKRDPHDSLLHQKYEEAARYQLKRFFLLHAIAQVEKIEATPQDVDETVRRDAAAMRLPYAELKQRVERSDSLLHSYRMVVKEAKALDRVHELAAFNGLSTEAPALPPTPEG
jgi:trigger factor